MAELVVPPSADDRQHGAHRLDEGRRARCSTAVMWNLQHPERRRRDGLGERGLDSGTDITRQHD